MNGRMMFTVVGAAITTFLLVAVVILEVLDFAFAAIIAVPGGMLVGLGVLFGLLQMIDDLSLGIRRLISAYAAFGLTILGLLALWYVNVIDEFLQLELFVMTGLLVAVVVYFTLLLSDR